MGLTKEEFVARYEQDVRQRKLEETKAYIDITEYEKERNRRVRRAKGVFKKFRNKGR